MTIPNTGEGRRWPLLALCQPPNLAPDVDDDLARQELIVGGRAAGLVPVASVTATPLAPTPTARDESRGILPPSGSCRIVEPKDLVTGAEQCGRNGEDRWMLAIGVVAADLVLDGAGPPLMGRGR